MISTIAKTLSLGLLVLLPLAARHSGEKAPPAGPFRAWDGAWEGTFSTYRLDGEKVSEIRVRQVYRSESDDLQTAVFEDTHPDGRVERSTARNVREKDGTLRCEVTRGDSGKTTVHFGRISDGLLFWHRTKPEEHLEESFRERVVGDTYEIEGVGIYGQSRETVLLFTGRYARVEPAPR